MPAGIKKYLEEFVENRVEELSISKPKNNREYARLKDKAYELQSKLVPTLTDEQQDIFVEYEAAMSAQDAIMRDSLYRDGLLDGIKIAKLVLKCDPKDIDGCIKNNNEE